MRIWLMVIVASILLFPVSTIASMEPSEIEEIKRQAPLHIIGTVKNDSLTEDLSDQSTSPEQLRQMKLRISKVVKKPDEVDLSINDSFDVIYTYIPSWVAMNGGKKVDIYEGDQIEIWLERGEHGWEPASGGDTIDHLTYVENRSEPIPEPWTHWIKETFREYIGVVVMSMFVLAIIMVLFLTRRFYLPKG
ncbi:hypothetical protein H0266_16115 [Halobacillus locisalis]|uniref:Uncharacterized protein n=1 Tax=Halobacillus locisalis TaxID=220753 RepID=A0A838CWY0_9BACI|nr:hypothetical protein [Halobacillus locisalis]MBA2176424.1 hypothetical protein [Halobacillus locisalis]